MKILIYAGLVSAGIMITFFNNYYSNGKLAKSFNIEKEKSLIYELGDDCSIKIDYRCANGTQILSYDFKKNGISQVGKLYNCKSIKFDKLIFIKDNILYIYSS